LTFRAVIVFGHDFFGVLFLVSHALKGGLLKFPTPRSLSYASFNQANFAIQSLFNQAFLTNI